MFNLQQDNKKYFSSITVVIAVYGIVLVLKLQRGRFPKPVQLFALGLSVATYADFENECPFTRNEFRSYKRRKGLRIYNYVKKMKATIYLTYKPVNNDINVC
jgi:hypothetical protein